MSDLIKTKVRRRVRLTRATGAMKTRWNPSASGNPSSMPSKRKEPLLAKTTNASRRQHEDRDLLAS